MSEAPTNDTVSVSEEQDGQKKLSRSMVVNITLLCIVGAVSIIALMFGDFEGKVSRVVSTLMLFAAFTIFTAIEERKNRSSLEMSIHQLGNVYMLGATLIRIWSNWDSGETRPRNVSYFDPLELFFSTIFIILITRVGVHLSQKAASLVSASQPQLALTAKLATISLAVTTILFTLPISLDSFTVFGEFYWRAAVSILVFACLMISIGLWMAWTFKQKMPWTSDRKNMPKASSRSYERSFNDELGRDSRPVVEFIRPPTKQTEGPGHPAGPEIVSTLPQFSPPVQNLTAWPVMPFGGQPLPKNEHGRPDWNALAAVIKTYADSEKHFTPRK